MKYQDIKHLLKEGMKIKITNSNVLDSIGEEYIIYCIKDDKIYVDEGYAYFPFNNPKDELEIITNPDGSKWVHPSYVELYYQDYLIKERLKAGFTLLNYINEPQAQKGFIMNVVDKIKNFKLTKEDRILRENGLEDEDSNKMTNQARNMMSDEMIEERWATRRLEVAKDLLEIKNEEIKK